MNIRLGFRCALALLLPDVLLSQATAGADSATLITHASCVDSTRHWLGMFVGDYRVRVAYRTGADGQDSSTARGRFAWDLGGCVMIERVEGQRFGEPFDYLALWGTSGPPGRRIQRAFAHSQHGLIGLSEGRWNDTNDSLVLEDSAFVRHRWIQERLVVSRPRHGSFVMEGRRSEDGGHSWVVTHHATYSAIAPAPQAQVPDSTATLDAHGYFSLSVPDMDASAEWYVKKLGFRIRFRSPHTRTVHAGATLIQSGGLFIELVQQDSAADLSHYLPPTVTAAGGGLDYIHGVFKVGAVVDDIATALTTLRARGVEIAGWQAAKPDQPAAVTFKDNAGNRITLLEEPSRSAPSR